MEVINALGRRKSAVARVYVNTTGKGNITINDRPLDEYFKEEALRYIVKQPLDVTGTLEKFDIKVNLDGGGSTQMFVRNPQSGEIGLCNWPTDPHNGFGGRERPRLNAWTIVKK